MKLYLSSFIVITGILLITALSSCKKETSCEGCRDTNKPPVAIAGSDKNIALPVDSIELDGTASTDPDGTIVNFQWSKVSGPASWNLRTSNAAQVTADSLEQGVYLFELKVTDNAGLSDTDTVQVAVNNGSQTNRPPIANAGPDLTILLPLNAANLNGSNSSDPDNNIVGYVWTKISGTSSFNIANASAAQTQVSNLIAGNYQFELKVTDGFGLFDLDTMLITVFPETSALACVIPGSTQVASFPGPRTELASVVCNGKFYYSNGSVFDVFDPVSNSLNSTINLSMARAFVAGVSASDKVFFAGGYTNSSTTNQPVAVSRVDIYNTTTGTFSIAELSIPRYGVSTCAIGNKILFAGGNIDEFTETSRVDIYDLATNTWSHTELSQAGRFVSAIVKNKVWFVTHTSNQIDIYDPVTNSWSTSLLSSPVYSSLPAVIYNNAAITLNNKVYFTGCQTVRIYDIPSESWSSITLNENKYYIPAVVSNNKIAFIGGMTSWFVYSSLIEIYDPTTNSWSIQNMSGDLFYASFIAYNNYIYSSGGIIDQGDTRLSSICKFQL